MQERMAENGCNIAIDSEQDYNAYASLPGGLKIVQPKEIILVFSKEKGDERGLFMIGPMPSRWHRFWFRLLLGWHWEVVRDD